MTAAARVAPGDPRRRRWVAAIPAVALLAVASYWPATHARNALHLRAAQAAERRLDFPRAEAEVGHCLRAWPDDAEVRLLAVRVGWRSRLRGPFPSGWDWPLRDHLRAAGREPGWMDRVATETAVLDLLTGDARGPAAGLAARAGRGDADSVPLLEALARARLDAHQLPEALDYADAILHLEPGHALAHFWRGLAQELMGRWLGEADADYRRAADLEPANFAFRLQLASYLALRKENLAEARGRLEGLRAERPDSLDVLRPLGTVLLDLGDFAAARPVIDALVAARPRDGEALALLGQLELAADRPADAERLLAAAAAATPGSYAAHFQHSVCLDRLGRAAEAKAASGRAERVREDRLAISRLYSRVKEAGDDPRPRYELGVRHVRVGDVLIGRAWLKSVLDIDPAFEPARQALAESGAPPAP